MMAIKRFVAFCCAVVVALVPCGCIGEEPMDDENVVVVGSRLPDFEVVMNDSSTISGAQLRTTPSVVMFFHTGCPDCQKAIPHVQTLYDKFSTQGVQFAIISRADSAESVANYWGANALTMPYSAQDDTRIYNLFARKRVPRIYISNSNGVIKSIFTDDPVPTYHELESALEELL